MLQVWLVSIMTVCCLTAPLHATLNLNTPEWINFKRSYGKTYATVAEENTALLNFNYNSELVRKHNLYYERGTYTYSLRVNQFADLKLVGTLPTRFPVATTTNVDNSQAPPPVLAEPTELDPRIDPGVPLNVLDQGTVCNSGWAYATASAVELRSALQTLNTARPTASAQQLINCASTGNGCTNQVPQTGLDYLVQGNQPLYSTTSYPNTPLLSQQGFCLAPPTGATGVRVTRYSRINDNADNVLKQYVGNWFPVVVEYNPTSYQFMLYGEGVFQQPAVGRGSHFMTVVGYGHDVTRNLDYWLVQNSFGTQWGELGLMRVIRSTTKPLAKSAIFPSVVG